jgi:hypothetical protein
MTRPPEIKAAGPYVCHSCADGTVIVIPRWPQFPTYSELEGGGPGLSSRLALQEAFMRWLNAEEDV